MREIIVDHLLDALSTAVGPQPHSQPDGLPKQLEEAARRSALEMAITPYDVALCVLLRAYLCPDESDPSPHSALHASFGEALLQEIRRHDAVEAPSLFELLQRLQVGRAACRQPPPAAASRASPTPPSTHAAAACHAQPTPTPSSRRVKSTLQAHICPGADEQSVEGQYFLAVKDSVGARLSALGCPDDLVLLCKLLAEDVPAVGLMAAINDCTSAPGDASEGGDGADASSAMGLYLRMAYARSTAMPFEVRWRGRR